MHKFEDNLREVLAYGQPTLKRNDITDLCRVSCIKAVCNLTGQAVFWAGSGVLGKTGKIQPVRNCVVLARNDNNCKVFVIEYFLRLK